MITGLNMKKTYLEYRKGGGTQKNELDSRNPTSIVIHKSAI